MILSFCHHKPNTDHCFKSRNACVLVWSPKKTICPGFLESSTKGQWDEMQSDRRRFLLSYLADRWCRLCVGVLDERMRQWRTKMREAALSAKAELRERFKVFAKSQAGLLSTQIKQCTLKEANVSEWKWFRWWKSHQCASIDLLYTRTLTDLTRGDDVLIFGMLIDSQAEDVIRVLQIKALSACESQALLHLKTSEIILQSFYKDCACIKTTERHLSHCNIILVNCNF